MEEMTGPEEMTGNDTREVKKAELMKKLAYPIRELILKGLKIQ